MSFVAVLDDEPSDLDFEDTEETQEDEALPAPQYEIFSYPTDTTLKGYLEQWDKNQLYVPEFQRGFVWDQTRSSKLIESFLLGLPVPPAFLYKPAGSKAFWIIDGHQRIRTIVDFQKGVFAETRFRLKGVDARWAGKSFSDLSEAERFSLETSVLRAIVIQQTHPADHSSIYHIFERLNTGGIRLNAMEVRQCVYASNFLKTLKSLNEDESWREILGMAHQDKRLRDVELALRVVAFFRNAQAYEKPMKRFLNNCCIALKDDKDNTVQVEIADIHQRFVATCHAVRAALGAKPFHLRGRLNFGALDAVMSLLMRVGVPADLDRKFAALVADRAFLDAVSFNTSDESVVRIRIQSAERHLV